MAVTTAAPLPANFPIRAALWLAPAQRSEALLHRPAECAGTAGLADPALFEIGRAAFRAPLLLGGQAARSSLRCESCHSNGRRNAAFLFPGLSGSPGTADVTSSLMSSHRGNGIFDPKPIPDLAVPAKISRDPRSPALEAFIHGLIVQEFDGPEPSPLILQGLATYVRSIGQGRCKRGAREPIRLRFYIDDSIRAVKAAGIAWDRGDPPAARLLLSGARSTLGQIDERFTRPSLARDRQLIRNADLELLAAEQAMDRAAPDVPVRLAAWRSAVPGWSAPLLRDEPLSFFNATILKDALRLRLQGSSRLESP
jgi:hypothetical protein